MKLKIRASFADALRPPPFLSVSKWSEQYMVLSADYSASTGRFKAYPYQNGIMDAMTDSKNKTIVVMKSARSAGTGGNPTIPLNVNVQTTVHPNGGSTTKVATPQGVKIKHNAPGVMN